MNVLSTKFITTYRTKVHPYYWDGIALSLVFALLVLFVWNAKQMATPYHVGQSLAISLEPSDLFFYSVRSVTRMLIALIFSFLFTFAVGTWAAKSRRAERIIIPLLDVLQSVPILGFLSIAFVFFISLFPNRLLGPESAAIFVIFTSQAWNMTFSFYQTVRSVPAEIQEAARMFHLSAWQRFWRIEVPFSMPGLLWNTMMSMSAGWFFVVASEAITVSNQTILLPGIGSYIAAAILAADFHAIIYAILAMFVVILIYDQLLFRPLVAWSEKFKAEKQAAEKISESWVVNLFRRTRKVRDIGPWLARLFDAFVNIKIFRVSPNKKARALPSKQQERFASLFYALVVISIIGVSLLFIVYSLYQQVSMIEVRDVVLLGLLTAIRVFSLIILCSFIWVPVGVWIGLRPKLAQIVQPVAQIFAAFPANLLYPLFVVLIVTYNLNPNIWLTPLMILGAQWYILFNVVAGAITIPKDLLQVADNLTVTGWLRWRRLILPAIFPYYITGAITAAGGAWNASIVAEIASWGNEQVAAKGLGAYITQHTIAGDFYRVGLGIGMMCLFVLVFNRMLWRPLYNYAFNRFSLE